MHRAPIYYKEVLIGYVTIDTAILEDLAKRAWFVLVPSETDQGIISYRAREVNSVTYTKDWGVDG